MRLIYNLLRVAGLLGWQSVLQLLVSDNDITHKLGDCLEQHAQTE